MTNPDRLPLTSLDLAEDRKALLRKSFPEVFREDKIDFEALQRALGESVDPGKERFGLNWPGKAACSKLIQQASIGTLLPMRGQSVDFDSTENLIIEGDNLEVLKLLQKSYYGKVKMIYIDPPYNTGNEFIYPDNFHEGLQDYLKYSGQVDGEGRKQSSNAESNGRYHSNWLSMMYPRLFLARNLLQEDGVIFVSIDDKEVHNLRALMNEIFGEENFLSSFVWQSRTSISNDQLVSQNHNHILIYSLNFNAVKFKGDPLDESEYSNSDSDSRGPWKPVPIDANKPGGNTFYPVINPNTGKEFYPPNGRSWAINPDELKRLVADKRIYWGSKGDGAPKRKMFLKERYERGDTKTPSSVLLNAGTTQDGTNEVMELFDGTKVFSYPKPVTLLKKLIQYGDCDNAICLDFFTGSGTTAQAVMELNQKDNGNRKFILVQLPEPTDNPAYPTIADITRERVRRVSARLKAAQAAPDLLSDASNNAAPDLGFKAMRLTSSNFKVWDGRADQMTDVGATLQMFAEHVLPGRTPEDILHELLLKTGYPLTTPLTTLTLADKQVFSASEGALLICLEHELSLAAIEAMVARDPWLILCLDAGFAGQDELKANAMQTVLAHNRNRQSSMSLKVV